MSQQSKNRKLAFQKTLVATAVATLALQVSFSVSAAQDTKIDKEKVDQVYAELDMDVGRATELCLHYVQTCPGNQACRYGVQNALGMAAEIEDFFYGSELPAKVKIGVSGCAFNCAESMVRDVGVYGKKKGWTVAFGGNAARFPRVGDVLAVRLSNEEVVDLIKRCLTYYNEHALRPERTARFIRRIGIDIFKKAVLSG